MLTPFAIRERVSARPRNDGSDAMDPRNGCALTICAMSFFTSSVEANSSRLCSQKGPPSGCCTEWKTVVAAARLAASVAAAVSLSSGVRPSTTTTMSERSGGKAALKAACRTRQGSFGERRAAVSVVMAKWRLT